ncbi:hypothetical protein AB1K70_20625 [Bremerella sp. JC770]|uniref:hypothetical protein n=1 Tax=unclassified Bremerella TaxID=2795601 RepID=UPI002367B8E6|nr:hypothetical protein [Bremerella sp. P1]WDI43939.1 hypothetical protein PSR63_08325 [Bremerella sp. P1]
MLTEGEKKVLRTFRQYLMDPGRMLCFTGPMLATHSKSLTKLVKREYLVPESFKGAYSLTQSGFEAMRTCK